MSASASMSLETAHRIIDLTDRYNSLLRSIRIQRDWLETSQTEEHRSLARDALPNLEEELADLTVSAPRPSVEEYMIASDLVTKETLSKQKRFLDKMCEIEKKHPTEPIGYVLTFGEYYRNCFFFTTREEAESVNATMHSEDVGNVMTMSEYIDWCLDKHGGE